MRNLKGITFTTKPSTRSGLATVSEKNKKKGVSKEEKDLLASLKSLFPRDTRIVENDRTILGGKEIDILIPSYSLGIEYDGLYFHSEKDGKGPEYHYNKTLQCRTKGIQLIHIFSDEWERKRAQDIYKLKQITGLLDRVEKIDSISEIPTSKALTFFEANAIDPPRNLSDEICYGAFNDRGRIIACVSFSRKGSSWYVNHFEIRGGSYVEKALNQLVDKFTRDKLIPRIYLKVDNRWNNFRDFEAEGFVYKQSLKPEYTLTNTYNYRILQETFDNYYKDRIVPQTTEELLKINGYYKVWDCGYTLMEFKKRGS